MKEITTRRLTDILLSTDAESFGDYRREQSEHLAERTFAGYMAAVIAEKGLKKSKVIANSGLHNIYAYQILDGSKSPGRDKAICLLIGAGCSLTETQRGLEIAGLGVLYPKSARDAAVMVKINHGESSANNVNTFLQEQGLALLIEK